MQNFKKILLDRRALLLNIQYDNQLEEQLISVDNKSEMGELAYLHKESNIISLVDFKITRQIKEIDYALERIESGDYGHCADCGNDIEEKRLLAKPESNLCIDCQQMIEKRTRKVA